MNKSTSFLKNKFIKTITIILIIIVFLVMALTFWLRFSTSHGEKIAVPNLSKMTILKMKVALDNASLNYVIQDTTSFNPNFPPLSVIEQNPEFGEYVKKNRKIYIKLNPAGFQKIKMIKFYGKTKRQLEMQLTSIGFQIGTYSYVPDRGKNVVRGLTYNGKKIKAGSMIPKRAKINLILGDGSNGSVSTEEKEVKTNE